MLGVVQAAIHAVETADGRAELSNARREMHENPQLVVRQMFRLRVMYHKNLRDAVLYLEHELARLSSGVGAVDAPQPEDLLRTTASEEL